MALDDFSITKERSAASVAIPELLTSLILSSQDAIYVCDMKGTVIFWNYGAEAIFGYDASEFIGKKISTLIPAENHDDLHEILSKIAKHERIEDYQTTRVTKNGKLLDVSMTISPVIDKSGELIGASTVVRDVTSQMHLQRENATMASIVESSDDAILSKTLEGIIVTWNRGAERLYGYTREEMTGKHVSILAAPEETDEIPAIMERLRRGERIDHYETTRVKKNGTRITVSLTVSPVMDMAGNIIGASAIARDITDRKKTEDQIRQQFQEKDVLLREVYHRVKNNLQVVSSLLELRRRYSKDEDKDAAFKDSIERIKAMSLIHERLYKFDNLASISFKEYLESLIQQLLRSYSMNRPRIEAVVSGDNCNLTLNTAVPLGLVFNELITNSIKYAFVARETGKIEIRLHKHDKFMSIELFDNGGGLPVDLDFSSAKTFGFRIISLLIEQLQGTIEVRPGTGTNFEIEIPFVDGA